MIYNQVNQLGAIAGAHIRPLGTLEAAPVPLNPSFEDGTVGAIPTHWVHSGPGTHQKVSSASVGGGTLNPFAGSFFVRQSGNGISFALYQDVYVDAADEAAFDSGLVYVDWSVQYASLYDFPNPDKHRTYVQFLNGAGAQVGISGITTDTNISPDDTWFTLNYPDVNVPALTRRVRYYMFGRLGSFASGPRNAWDNWQVSFRIGL